MPQDEKQPVAAEAPRRGGLMRTLVIIAAVVLLEAVTVVAVMWFARGEKPVEADPNIVDQAAIGEQPVEMLILSEKFQNSRSGIAYMYDTEVYAIVKRRNQPFVESRLEASKAEISRDINTIFRKAEPSQLAEGDLATLTRQVKAVLDQHFGNDEDTGEPYISEAIIRKCIRYRADM